MVFPDLSTPAVRSVPKDSFPIAPLSDRLIALILDFLIISPLVSLFVAGFLKQTRTFFLLNSTAQEAMVAAGLLMGLIFFLVVLLQATFLFFWQATPGQLFLQLRVVSYPQAQGRLTLNQCFLRSFLWCAGFLVLALPFLEVASHPLRRAFHERASDTGVITLKERSDEGPHPIESRFIASWMRMSFLLLLLFLAIGFSQSYQSLMLGEYKEMDSRAIASSSCKELKDMDFKGPERLDATLTLFLLEAVSSECLKKEADAVLWAQPEAREDLGYVAKYVLTDGEEQNKYFEKICEDREGVSCLLVRYLSGEGSLDELTPEEVQGFTVQFLVSEERFAQQDVLGSLKIIESLQKTAALKTALEKRYVRAVWVLHEGLELPEVRGGRQPASEEKALEWIEKFRERYEVP